MSNISRSEYQKVVEENKRLKGDIKLLVSPGLSPEKVLCYSKWRQAIQREEDFNKTMKIVAKRYIEENKDSLPDFLKKIE